MSPENLQPTSPETKRDFLEEFPHLHHLTEEEQSRFLVLHRENKAREEHERETEEALLKKLSTPIPKKKEEVTEKQKTPDTKKTETVIDKVKKASTNIVDFIPVIGSTKMILEALQGRQYGTGKKIEGKIRVIHGLSGLGFLAADLTGVGAIASELGKVGIKIGTRVIEKELLIATTKEVAQHAVLKEEAMRLAVRGNTRVDKKVTIKESTEPVSA